MSREFATAATGAKVVMDVGDWEDTIALKGAIVKELATSDLSQLLSGGLSAASDVDVTKLAKLVFLIDSSPAVYEALFRCLRRCTYNGQRIEKNTFEPAKAREDFYEIAIACLVENIGPFFKTLLSKLRPIMGKLEELQQKMTQSSK